MAGHLKTLDNSTNDLDAILNKQVPIAERMIKDNVPHWEQMQKVYDRLMFIQKEFPVIRIADPHKAEKMAKEHDQLDKDFEVAADKLSDNLDKLYDNIEETIATLGTGVRTLLKQQKALEKHKTKANGLF